MSEQVEAPQFYRIGTAGKEWGEVEKAAWLADAGQVKRAYAEEVLEKLEPLKEQFDVEQYGALSLEVGRSDSIIASDCCRVHLYKHFYPRKRGRLEGDDKEK